MQIIKNKAIAEDNWQFISPETARSELPAGDIVLPLRLWTQYRSELAHHHGKLGVALVSSEAIEEITSDLKMLTLIALEFPAFKDGRHYSSARLLRDRYGFKGELRAYGDVNKDQLYYLSRVGFDTFQLKEGADLESAVKSFADFSVCYQPSHDLPLPLYRRC